MAVLAIHAAVGLVLMQSVDVGSSRRASAPLSVFEVPEPPPPPPVERVETPKARPKRATAPSGGSAPATRIDASDRAPARAKPQVRIARATRLATAPEPGLGRAQAGVGGATGGHVGGVGTGGAGTGDGAGVGSGSGGGGTGTGARKLGGRLSDSDYPRAARRAGAQGTVFVRFLVDPDGRVGRCTVTRTSGNADLDAATCSLIQRRFRYAPARDANGQAVADEIVGRQVWWIGRRDGPAAGRARDIDDPGPKGEADDGIASRGAKER